MTAPTYQYRFDPARPSPFPIEFVMTSSDEVEVIFGVPSDQSTNVMPLEEFNTLLAEHYPWAIEEVETCPTCGR